MDNELSKIINQKEHNWVYSGKDNHILKTIVSDELNSSIEHKLIRIVILCEDMMRMVVPLLSATGRLKGTVPTYGCKYFPIKSDIQPEETVNHLLQLLRLNGISEEVINKANAYIAYLLYLDGLSTGCLNQFDISLLFKYSTISTVEHSITEVFTQRKINESERLQLLERYAELKSVGPLIENTLSMLNNTFFLQNNRSRRVSNLSSGDSICFLIKSDMTQIQIEELFQLISWDIIEANRKGKRIAISVFEGKRKYGSELSSFLRSVIETAKISLYTKDFYSGHNTDWLEEIEGYFDVWVFSSHNSMNSCEAISKTFGEMPIVRKSYSCDRDRRLESNRFIDRLFNTNRVDHYVEHVPSWEPRFRKEEIYSMPSGMCLVKADGEGYWIQIQ